MKALIVIETCFGNTEQIAHAIADGLRTGGADIEVIQAADAPTPQGFDLLLVGSPTHSMGLPKAATRHQARAKGGHPNDTGIAEWLDALTSLAGQRVAAFSTITGGIFSGSASKAIEKRLRKLNATVVGREDFTVRGTEGPLADGEIERANNWGTSLT
ncbi:flavodoxin family protein [Sediminivirga luteola]|uniref:Flavodoxin n=2 Tax=Actinomycetes TaxID=1760 RepID=A0A8J2U141_9MICO|nr:flavodoxin domain-containing protein [Sediminivirga luteola]GGA27427.1 flavodoxin [Sediminivirga luteola]